MTLGERIKEARWERGMTQKELSEKTGIHINALSFYERDMVDPSFCCVVWIAEALEVSLDYLAGKEDLG
jgi:transcriptional regulator with XRE-family HTH domain